MPGSTVKTPNYEKLAAQAAGYEAEGQLTSAARFYQLAGQKAVVRYDFDAGAGFFSQALNLTPDAQRAQRYLILLAREQVYRVQGSHVRQGRDLESLSALADSLQDDSRRAEVAVRQAAHYAATGELTTAVTIGQLAVRLAVHAGSEAIEAAGRLAWGEALLQQGQYDGAGEQLTLALQLAQKMGDRQVEADGARAIGLHFLNRGDMLQARLAYEKAQEIYAEIGDRLGQSYVLNNLGHIAYDQSRFDEAGRYWHEVLPVYRDLGDRTGETMALNNLGSLYLDIGDYEQAHSYQQEVLALSRQIRSGFGEGIALVNLSLVHHYQNENTLALESAQAAVAKATAMGNRRLEGYAQAAAGQASYQLQQPQAARAAYWQALAIWEELAQANLKAATQAGLAQVALDSGELEEALQLVGGVLAQLAREPGLDGTEAPLRTYYICYQVLKATQPERAASILADAHERLQLQAGAIQDEGKRQRFLSQVAVNRDIMAEFEQLSRPAS